MQKSNEMNKKPIHKVQYERVHLNALNIDISLNEGQSYQDMGYVAYISPPLHSYYLSDGIKPRILGKCSYNSKLSKIKIRYLKLSNMENYFVRGHEEGHGLFYLGRLGVLYEEFLDSDITPEKIRFSSTKAKNHDSKIKSILKNGEELYKSVTGLFENEELLAHLTGILTLKKNNYSDINIRTFVKKHRYISPLVLDCL